MHAMLGLAEFGPAAKAAAPKAVEMLGGDEFSGAQYAAAYALGRFGVAEGAIEPLEKAAGNEDSLLKLIAVQSLARLKPEDVETVKRAAEELAEALKSENPTLRAAAARGLAEFGGSSELTAPALEKAVADAEPAVIANAVTAFVELGAKAVPRVKNGIKNEKLRHYAVHILSRIGPDAKDAVPELIAALQNDDGSDPQFRAEVQFALGTIGSTSPDAVGELVESLSSEDERVRHSACFALRKIGPAAAEAVEPLKQNLASEDRFLALVSIWALLSIQPGDQATAQQAVPLLAEGLSHENEMVGIESARSLGELGPAAKPALEKLEAIDGSEALKAAAAEAIMKINS
jgi:HEAT repeat protein